MYLVHIIIIAIVAEVAITYLALQFSIFCIQCTYIHSSMRHVDTLGNQIICKRMSILYNNNYAQCYIPHRF